MKTKIETLENGNVKLSFMNPVTNEISETVYMAFVDGGYVRFADTGNQVCERLGTSGITLQCGKKENLIDVIRSEYKKLRYHLRKQMA